MNQRGFATLEVILMVMVIGILASIAVPRFTDVTTKANVAKIQADLSTIDTAIAVYNMDGNTALTSASELSALNNYLKDASNIKPPKGTVYVKSGNSITSLEVKDTDNYGFKEVNGEIRAVLSEHTAGDFTTQKPTSE